MWDLGSPIRDQTRVPYVGSMESSPPAAREVPGTFMGLCRDLPQSWLDAWLECSTCLLQSTVLSAPALCLSDRLVGFRHGWVRRGMVDAPTELRAWWYQWWVMG